ncbi:MAG: sigma-54-dependent Fis family transcriptional regulator, partial [Proteobacteria bacterium]|nr:sigma-54-dependent Fis family transcriptional regulator [Pseudomonadota bacterium]
MTFTPPGTIVLVDDDPVVLSATRQSLELADIAVRAFETAAEALLIIDADFNGAVITDIRMPEMDGLQLFARIRAIDPTIPVGFITGHGDVTMAVAALQDGAHDFLTKPFASAHLIASARRAIERRQLELDNRILRRQVDQEPQTSPMIGQTPVILRLVETISRIAGSEVDVLIEGETGVGKELAAIMLHRRGKRRAQPFV